MCVAPARGAGGAFMMSALVAARSVLSREAGGALVGVVSGVGVLGVGADGVGSCGGGGLDGVAMGVSCCGVPAGNCAGSGACCGGGCTKGDSFGGGL